MGYNYDQLQFAFYPIKSIIILIRLCKAAVVNFRRNKNLMKKCICQYAIGNEIYRTFKIMLAIAFIAILFYQIVYTSADRMVSVHWDFETLKFLFSRVSFFCAN